MPAAPHYSSNLVGTYFKRDSHKPGFGLASWQGEMDIASGEVLWERIYPEELRTDAGCEVTPMDGLMDGVASRGRSFAFPACNGHLILFRDRDDTQGFLVEAPLYAPELPNPWEVDDYRALRRSSARAGGFVPPHSVQDYASTPKSYSRILRFDERERLWVLTNRNRYDFSYLDVYSDTAFVGAVRIRDRAEGFDVLGSTLAVLVDRRVLPGDTDGFPDREIDWYDIGRLEVELVRARDDSASAR